MARCSECAWFPWKPGADLSGLPAMRCHPESPMRRWSTAERQTTCEHYKPVERMEPPPRPEPKAAPEVPVETSAKTKGRAGKNSRKG